jgi:hypothetical protein
MLPEAELIDIIVPLNSGTCSIVRLTLAVLLIPTKRQPAKVRDNEIHRFGTIVKENMKTPAIKEDMKVTGFLPNLCSWMRLSLCKKLSLWKPRIVACRKKWHKEVCPAKQPMKGHCLPDKQ